MIKFTQERIADHQKDQEKADLEKGAGALKTHDRPEDFLTKFFAKIAQNPDTFTMYYLRMGCESVCSFNTQTVHDETGTDVYMFTIRT